MYRNGKNNKNNGGHWKSAKPSFFSKSLSSPQAGYHRYTPKKVEYKVWDENNLTVSEKKLDEKVKDTQTLEELEVLVSDSQYDDNSIIYSEEIKTYILDHPSIIFHLLKSDEDLIEAERIFNTQSSQSFDLSNSINQCLVQSPDNITEYLLALEGCNSILEKFSKSLAEDRELYLRFINKPRDFGLVTYFPNHASLLIDELINDDEFFDAIVPNSQGIRHILEMLCIIKQKELAMNVLDYILQRDKMLEKLILTNDPSSILTHDALKNFMNLNMSLFEIVNQFFYHSEKDKAYRIDFANLVFNKSYTAALDNEAIRTKAFSHMSHYTHLFDFFLWQESYLSRIREEHENGSLEEGLSEVISNLSAYATNILKTTLIDGGELKKSLSHWLELVALAEVIPEDDMSIFMKIILEDEELCRRICHQSEDLSRTLFQPQDNGRSTCGDHPYIPSLSPIKPLTDFYPYVVPLLKYMNESERELIEKVTIQKHVIKYKLNDYLLKNPESLESIKDRPLTNGVKNMEDDEIVLEEKPNNNNNNDDEDTSSFSLTL